MKTLLGAFCFALYILLNFQTPYTVFEKQGNHISANKTNNRSIIKDLGLTDHGNVILLVVTKFDCATCINDQLSYCLRVMGKDMFNKKVILITDSENIKVMQNTWNRIIKHNRIFLRSIKDLRNVYNYKGTPVYYLASPRKGICDKYFNVDLTNPEISKDKFLQFVKTL